VSAVNGKTLEMTPSIKKLFKNNNFGWRKSVIGCAMSHINVWAKIVSSPGEYFLILEDDVRFNTEQIKLWSEYAKNIPQGADLLYLGGVLPSNMSVFPSVLEPVNNFWSKIKPNKYFTPSVAAPIFHFCLYSYIISKSAAQKILYYLMNTSMTSAVDHFVVSASVNLNTFVASPLITSCFQYEDPNYLNANFDSTTSKFDSDIYNNLECFDEDKQIIFTMDVGNLYEHAWMTDILGGYELKSVKEFTGKHNSWFLVQRPHLNEWTVLFKDLQQKNIPFKILHLSDEGLVDPIDYYSYSNCKAVIRNYVRSDANLPHVLTVPLGYHHKAVENKTFSERELVWSFHGNEWFGRAEHLKTIEGFAPFNCHLIQEWASPKMTTESHYLRVLTNSKLCPILRGNNFETYRLYEALEAGAIPFYVRTDGDSGFWNFITSKLPLVHIDSWDKVQTFISSLLSNPIGAEEYRKKLLAAWMRWKSEIISSIKMIK
jgi:GR25 family glycosyltransferase involved in LPS biosynthesis